MKGLAILSAVFLVGFIPSALAQTPGEPDISFNSGSLVDNPVLSVVSAGGGKVYIGGYFTSVRGAVRNRIARLNADGSVDKGFDPGIGAGSLVRSMALQTDGKLLIGGDFTSYNGVECRRIARLNEDGSLDASFDPGSAATGAVRSVVLQADGKVLIGGDFISYNGLTSSYIARLNADGSPDAGFDPGNWMNGEVYSIALQTDGKLLIGGDFSRLRNRIARLNGDGSLDASFDPGSGANDSIYSLVLQTDG
ncbi:MAG: delta-60 repeat domain-containing protein, partial [Verrucomicrobiae bacterium]|nr:delta-60 repeat domain-containing protein [Verrucomicrobiae bacterium]